jgi:hypothetical protein
MARQHAAEELFRVTVTRADKETGEVVSVETIGPYENEHTARSQIARLRGVFGRWTHVSGRVERASLHWELVE